MIDVARALKVPGWMTLEELRWLADQATRARVIVECGCYQGRSTRALADHCPGIVYAIDLWQGPCLTESGAVAANDWAVWPAFATHLRDHLSTGRVRALRVSSAVGLRDLLALGPVVDLGFIDADHRRDVCAEDISAILPLMRPGAILAGHDYHNETWPGVTLAVDAAFGSRVQVVGGIWWVAV